jgi:hypothetical protein
MKPVNLPVNQSTVRSTLWPLLDAGYVARVAARRAARTHGTVEGSKVVQAVGLELKKGNRS